jgi:hypothetical protein
MLDNSLLNRFFRLWCPIAGTQNAQYRKEDIATEFHN